MQNLRSSIKYSIVLFVVFFLLHTDVLRSEESPAAVLSHSAFSPNNDGYRDSVYISLRNITSDIRYPSNWIVTIKNEKGIPVNKFAADRRLVRAEPSLKNFYLPGKLEVKPLEIFQNLEWNGKDDSGNIVPDGVYSIEISVTGKKNTEYAIPEIQLNVDTIPPELKLTVLESVIVRPADEKGNPLANLNEASLLQKSDSPGSYRGSILDRSGNIVDERNWTGNLPDKVLWNGKTKKIENAAYGSYGYRLTAEDAAGNISVIEYNNIIIATNDAALFPDCGICVFNPDATKPVFNIIFRKSADKNFSGEIYNKNNVSWSLEISGEKDASPVFNESGTGMPEKLEWSPSPEPGKKIKDGLFRVRVTLKFNNEEYISPYNYFYLDSTPPEIALRTSSVKFTPGYAGKADALYFYPEYSDRSAVRGWLLQIYIVPDSKNIPESLFRSFRGEDAVPAKIRWNGDGEGKKQLKSGEFLEARFYAKDISGNISAVARIRLKTGIIVESRDTEGKFLIINIPEQEYFDDKSALTLKGRSILDEMAEALEDYGWYDVHIESHASFPGREEDNIDLTERRAKSMYDYILKKDFNEETVDYRGFGETELTSKANDVFVHYRNARIQIMLERRSSVKK